MKYGQFCPIAKATEILGERWTILIVRELLAGARRFNELQRGLGDISPALLSSRLKNLERDGLLIRRRITGQKGYEYDPTPACQALGPTIVALGEWGICWARETICDEDFNVELLMLYLERSVDPVELPRSETIIQFKFTDLSEQKDWWLVVRSGEVEVCITAPRRDVHVFFTTDVRTMSEVWMGDRSYREAILAGDLFIEGEPALTRRLASWLRPSRFATAPRAPSSQPKDLVPA
jgi:DNA-binding HxlR family transcriptional regulator